MTNGPSFMGIPIHFAGPGELRATKAHGTLIHRWGELAFYQVGRYVVVVPEKPADGEQGDKAKR